MTVWRTFIGSFRFTGHVWWRDKSFSIKFIKCFPVYTTLNFSIRFVYDKISINVRGVEALGVNSSQYGSLLIPVVISKLPQDVRLQIARNTAQDVWEMSELLSVIRKEVEAREISDTHVRYIHVIFQSTRQRHSMSGKS